MKKEIINAVVNATGRAFATCGPNGINVIPVSAAQVEGDVIYLFDFFMDKTVKNIKVKPEAALSCWDGLAGIQIKAIAEYLTEGVAFVNAQQWAYETYPDRTLRGIIALHPTGCFSISPLSNPGASVAFTD